MQKINLTLMKSITQKSQTDFLSTWKGIEDVDMATSLLIHRCAEDFGMFCTVFFPHYATLPFCAMHRNQFEAYSYGERGVNRADAAPRGYAKSTVKALFRPIWDICYHQERYILVSSNTEDQAIQKIKDIRTELLENNLLASTYGKFFNARTVSAQSYVTLNRGFRTLVQAAGSKKELRGKRFGANRPTKIIIDDFEHSTEVESEMVREKTKNIYYDVFTKLGNKKTNIEVIGTILHRQSLLKDLISNPGYQSHVYKSIIAFSKREDLWSYWKELYTNLDNEDRGRDSEEYFNKHGKEMLEGTKVLWPEHESYLDLQKEIVKYGKRTFMKEKQNSPMSDDEKIFDLATMKYFIDFGEYFELCHNNVKVMKSDMKAVYGVIDPATGQTAAKKGKRGDYSCILTGYVDGTGRLWVCHDYTQRTAPSSYIRKMIGYNEQFKYRLFGVEENLFRDLLSKNIKDEQKLRNEKNKTHVRMPIHRIYQKEKKEKRIYTIEPKVEHGWIVFNKSLSSTFYEQMADFPKADHDDCPDALEMLWNLTHKEPVGGIRAKRW